MIIIIIFCFSLMRIWPIDGYTYLTKKKKEEKFHYLARVCRDIYIELQLKITYHSCHRKGLALDQFISDWCKCKRAKQRRWGIAKEKKKLFRIILITRCDYQIIVIGSKFVSALDVYVLIYYYCILILFFHSLLKWAG